MSAPTVPVYRKTKKGEWVVFGPAAAVRVGEVAVAKRDGTIKKETIARVSKPFLVDGKAYVYGTIAEEAR